ncbi:PREDICTED: rhythmically expressed gene 5 protein [Acromyrmex echinatior]|uniref:Rhythmically expressed gene 5 protein n=1 Tax=Acromyrmex echinatior TaxID=103372 RepID=F4WQI9_ACREC|nr:PREDICTED: rhythmically expressed gene 5 protein [Acromyrmex echinatior]EGI63516.1 Rhythmically expressed gene 5 protein [Acromyrmex echinatior]
MMISGISIAKIATCILLGCCVMMRVTGSAIPMWEFLSRDEKMSHLYGLFSKQVARFCADSSRPDCNKNLLVTGIRSLASMDDNVLDRLDPYQRGAKEMIWHAMVGSNRFASRISHETEESYFTTVADLANSGSETNGLGEETVASGDYIQSSESSRPYLSGPMVIRVYPDGRPVPEDQKRPLPKDEDVDELRYSRLPSIEEIEAKSGSKFYGKRTIEPSMLKRRMSFIADDKNYRRSQALRLRHPLSYERTMFRDALNERGVHYY